MDVDSNDSSIINSFRPLYPSYFTDEDIIIEIRKDLRNRGFVQSRIHPHMFKISPIKDVCDILHKLKLSTTVSELEEVAAIYDNKDFIPSWALKYKMTTSEFMSEFEGTFLQKEIRTREYHCEINTKFKIKMDPNWLKKRKDIYEKFGLITNWPEIFSEIVKHVPEDKFRPKEREFTWKILRKYILVEMDYDYFIYSNLSCLVSPEVSREEYMKLSPGTKIRNCHPSQVLVLKDFIYL